MNPRSQAYKIERWDAVLFGNSTDPTPIIYVKPDETLLTFAKENNDALLVKINLTSSIFDGKRVAGVFKKSSEIPNCRENYFKKTGYYVIILQAEWHGYPDCLGEIEIYGLKGGVPVKTIEEFRLKGVPKHDINEENNPKQECSTCGMGTCNLVAVGGGIIVIFLAILIITKK